MFFVMGFLDLTHHFEIDGQIYRRANRHYCMQGDKFGRLAKPSFMLAPWCWEVLGQGASCLLIICCNLIELVEHGQALKDGVLHVPFSMWSFVRRLLPHTRAWPRRIQLVLDEGSAESCLKAHKVDYECYTLLKDAKGTVAKAAFETESKRR